MVTGDMPWREPERTGISISSCRRSRWRAGDEHPCVSCPFGAQFTAMMAGGVQEWERAGATLNMRVEMGTRY